MRAWQLSNSTCSMLLPALWQGSISCMQESIGDSEETVRTNKMLIRQRGSAEHMPDSPES